MSAARSTPNHTKIKHNCTILSEMAEKCCVMLLFDKSVRDLQFQEDISKKCLCEMKHNVSDVIFKERTHSMFEFQSDQPECSKLATFKDFVNLIDSNIFAKKC